MCREWRIVCYFLSEQEMFSELAGIVRRGDSWNWIELSSLRRGVSYKRYWIFGFSYQEVRYGLLSWYLPILMHPIFRAGFRSSVAVFRIPVISSRCHLASNWRGRCDQLSAATILELRFFCWLYYQSCVRHKSIPFYHWTWLTFIYKVLSEYHVWVKIYLHKRRVCLLIALALCSKAPVSILCLVCKNWRRSWVAWLSTEITVSYDHLPSHLSLFTSHT
jgi:hypothetical protein